MATNELIDSQFDRAVEIVQGLPKTGPIQTDYEEKLTMYSLYKQATVGNVKSPRPGMWDMLGRAKWDAWAKHKDLEPYEAKWLYVDALLKVLRKYSDKTIARQLVEELESYGGDPSNIVLSRTLSGSPDSDSSGSDDEKLSSRFQHSLQRVSASEEAPASSEEETEDDEPGELPALRQGVDTSQPARPGSSVSSHRYRTPMADSLAMSPSGHPVPASQPLPGFETPSAFAEHPISSPSSFYPTSSLVGPYSQSSQAELTSPPLNAYPPSLYQGTQVPSVRQHPLRPSSRPTLESAVERVQAQIAALNERLEMIESISHHPSRSHLPLSPRGARTPSWTPGRGSPPYESGREWDLDDLGMWSLVVLPMAKGIEWLREAAGFFARNDNRSPSRIIVRRLCLDVSFLFFIIGFIRFIWRRSGVRRREVYAALIVLCRAILGTKPPKSMVERGI